MQKKVCNLVIWSKMRLVMIFQDCGTTCLNWFCNRHGYTPLDKARDNDKKATLKVLEAEVALVRPVFH
jgi:hypothetical protein